MRLVATRLSQKAGVTPTFSLHLESRKGNRGTKAPLGRKVLWGRLALLVLLVLLALPGLLGRREFKGELARPGHKALLGLLGLPVKRGLLVHKAYKARRATPEPRSSFPKSTQPTRT